LDDLKLPGTPDARNGITIIQNNSRAMNMQCEIHGTRSMALFDSSVENSGISPRMRKCVYIYINFHESH